MNLAGSLSIFWGRVCNQPLPQLTKDDLSCTERGVHHMFEQPFFWFGETAALADGWKAEAYHHGVHDMETINPQGCVQCMSIA